MERRKIYLTIFFLLVLLFLTTYIIFNEKLKKWLYRPALLKDESSIQDTVSCDPGINPLQKCETLGDPCIQCKDGLFSCQKVDSPLSIKNESGAPFTVPPGQWCLPAEVQSVKCNLDTSTPVLTRYSDGLYKWRCYCKYPNWVISNSLDGDCDKEVACGKDKNPNNYLVFCKKPDGSIIDPVVSENKYYVCPEGSTQTTWTPSDQIDIAKHAFCHCDAGLIYNENKELEVKECVANPCGEGGSVYRNADGTLGCKCPEGKISCDALPDNKRQECSIGCITDPCKPHGEYHKELNGGKGGCKCKCDEYVGDACVNGYIFMEDENFLANGYCQKVNDACGLITADRCEGNPDALTEGDCNCNRGGQCITCPKSAGYGDVKVMVPYCVNCGPDRGFKYEPVDTDNPAEWCKNEAKNCTTCGLWFTECDGKTGDGNVGDSLYCCTGRCASDGDYKGNCEPCNGDIGRGDKVECEGDDKDQPWNCGYINQDDDDDLKEEKQGRWDDHCNSKTGGEKPFCNSYNISWPQDIPPQGAGNWKSGDGRIGICEAAPPKTGDDLCGDNFDDERRRVCRYGYA